MAARHPLRPDRALVSRHRKDSFFARRRSSAIDSGLNVFMQSFDHRSFEPWPWIIARFRDRPVQRLLPPASRFVFSFPSCFSLPSASSRPFLRGSFQLLLDGLRYELTQRDTTLGRHRLRPAKEKIGDFKRRLHGPILPYLWDLAVCMQVGSPILGRVSPAWSCRHCPEAAGRVGTLIQCRA